MALAKLLLALGCAAAGAIAYSGDVCKDGCGPLPAIYLPALPYPTLPYPTLPHPSRITGYCTPLTSSGLC